MKKTKHEKMLKKRFNIKNQENVQRINNKISKEINKKDLWKTREQIKNNNYKRYCEKYNLDNTEKTYNTYGGWKNRKVCSTKSQLEWQYETEGREEKEKKPVKIEIGERAVILYDEETGDYDAYKAEVEKINNDITVKIINGRKKIRVKVYEGIIDNEELLEMALKYNAYIYCIDEIEN
jgi:hypothetical protein